MGGWSLLSSCPCWAQNEPKSRQPSAQSHQPDNQSDILEWLGAKRLRVNPDETMLAEGAVRVRWREYLLQAEKAEGSAKERQYLFSDGVSLTGEGIGARGDRLWVDTRKKTWWLEGGRADLSPQFVQGNLLSDLFLRGGRVEGEPGAVRAQDTHATTCDLERPHYELLADDVEAIPDRRAVLKRVHLQVLGHTWFTLPRLVIPLKRTGQRSLLPEVGFSQEEGYYLKYAMGYFLAREAFGNARFDLMQRRGIGLGLDQTYRYGTGSLYYLNDRNRNTTEWTGRLNHRQSFGILQTNWNLDYRRNSFVLFPENTTWNLSTNWLLPSSTGTTQLNARMSRSETGDFQTRNESYSLQEARRLGRLRWNLNSDYNVYESLTSGDVTSSRKEVNLRFNFGYDLQGATAELAFQRSIPVGSSAPFFAGLERAPELGVSGNLSWLGVKGLDSTFRLSLGRFAEGGLQNVRTERYAFEIQGSRQWAVGSRARSLTAPEPGSGEQINPQSPIRQSTLTWQYGFRQSFYGDNTAQYLLRSDLEQRWQWGPKSAFSLRWNYLRPYGYSPFFLDRVGFYNQLAADLRWFFGGGWSLAAQTGYDLLARESQRDPWQSLWLNLLYERGEWLRWRVNGIYDPNRGRFSNVLTDLSWQFGASRLYLNARYDPRRNRWGRVNTRLDSLKWGRFRFSTILFYNGFLNRFEGRHFLVTYDLHCAEIELRYIENPFGFRRDKEILLFVRLKAFPSLSRFGYGQFGQALGGFGEAY